MLTVGDLFKRLSYGVLSNLAMATATPGTIRSQDQNKIIGYANQALMRIYSNFNLAERQVLIQQYGHITNYHLDKRFAKFNPDRQEANLPYILDLPNELFKDDAIKILAVFDEVGTPLTLNDEGKALSLYTPYPTVLQIPYPRNEVVFAVQYQASHPELLYGITQAEITIPRVLEDALMDLIAYYTYSHMNTQEATAKAAEHMSMYQALVGEVKEQGHASIIGLSTLHKFDRNGWK